jgi:uncharacterized membrane protein YbhN (UPF0104 family)
MIEKTEPIQEAKSRLKTFLKIGLACGVLGIIIFTVPRLNWAEIRNAFVQAQWGWVGGAFVLLQLTWLARAWLLWSISRLKASLSFTYVWAVHVVGGIFDQTIPGRSGFFVRWGLFSVRVGQRKSFFLSVLMVFFLMEALSLLSVFIISSFFSPQVQSVSQPVVLTGALIFVLSVGVGLWSFPLIEKTLKRFKIFHWGPLDAFFEMAHSVRSPERLLGWFGLGLLNWTLQLVGLWVLAHAFGFSLNLFAYVVLLVSINLAIAIPLIPGNVGTMQVVITFVLTQFFKVDPSTALAYSIVYHLVQFSGAALPAAVSIPFLPLKAAKKIMAV